MATYYGVIGGDIDVNCGNIRTLTVFLDGITQVISPGPGLLWTKTGAGPGNVAFDDPVNGIANLIQTSSIWGGGQPPATANWIITATAQAVLVDGFLDCEPGTGQQGISLGTTNCVVPNDTFTFNCSFSREAAFANIYGCCNRDCAGDFTMHVGEGGKSLCLPSKICFKGVDVTPLFQDYIDNL